jgi:hypothetical protein
MLQRGNSLDFEWPTLVAEAGRNHAWLFMLTAKPHFLLRVAAATQCAA